MNIAEEIRKAVDEAVAKVTWRGIVVSQTTTTATVVRYTGGASATYQKATSCPTLSAGNEVMMLAVGQSYVVMDKLR